MPPIKALLAAGAATLLMGAAQPVDLPGHYDPNNAYARAARGELPVAKLYEDDQAIAYLVHNPYTVGHFLVVSKVSHARNFLEVEPDVLMHMWAVAQRVARAEIVALHADGFVIRSNAGAAGATPVFHIHVITMRTGVPMDETRPEKSLAELEPIAAQVRAALQ
jgi:histidine triad (HIT) family protein